MAKPPSIRRTISNDGQILSTADTGKHTGAETFGAGKAVFEEKQRKVRGQIIRNRSKDVQEPFSESAPATLIGALDLLAEDKRLRKTVREQIKSVASLVEKGDLTEAHKAWLTLCNLADRDSHTLFYEVFQYFPRSNEGTRFQVRLSERAIQNLAKLKPVVPKGLSVEYPSGTQKEEQLHSGQSNEIEVSPLEPISVDARWTPRPRGRPPKGVNYDEQLFDFIRTHYKKYLGLEDERRNDVRAYIYNNDWDLYDAIQNYEFRGPEPRSLPEDIAMPTRPEKVEERLRKAARTGLGSLPKADRTSVTGKLRRMEAKREI